MFVTEYLTVHVTAIWTLPSTYTLKYLQSNQFPEYFISHITAIWMLPTMYMLMNLQMF